jgi:glycosyltransferase involved in cell wall biosynthesis
MRVLMVDNTPQMGGSIRCAAPMLRSLAENGIKTGLAASRPELFALFLDDRVRVVDIGWLGFRDVFDPAHRLFGGGLPFIGQWWALRRFAGRLVPALARVIDEFRPDVLLVNNLNLAQVPVLALAADRRLPAVVYARMIRLFGRRELSGADQAQRIICVSQAVREHLAAHYPFDARKLAVIYDGIEAETFSEKPDPALRASLDVPPDVPLVTLVGRMTMWKGQCVAISAWPKVRAAHPRAVLLIVGDGDPVYVELCKRRVREEGQGDAVRFVGHRDDVPQMLAVSDLLAHTSCFTRPEQGTVEAFGRVVVEAMAVGCPVVATRAGGVPELVADGETGYLVEPNDPDDLANKVIAALNDAAWRRRAGEAGRQRAQTHYRQAQTAEQTLALLRQVASEKS